MVGGAVAPLVINKASADPRFADHPGCVRLGVESYIAVPLRRRDGSLFGTLCALDPLPANLGEADTEIFRLLADLIAFEIEADDERRQRDRGEAAKQAFIDDAAHDLKGPLGVVRGRSQLLRRQLRRTDGIAPPQLEAGLREIESAAGRAAAIIDELLDAAHLETGRSLNLRLTEVDAVALARGRAAEWEQTAAGHVFRFEAECPTLTGWWDEDRLRRVLDNLLANAVKYSPAGGAVTVRVAAEEDQAVVAVADEGIGIPATDLPLVFERFRRGGNVGEIGGTGIGLAGAKLIVEQHGGTIAVASEDGAGSTFTVRLPLHPSDDHRLDDASAMTISRSEASSNGSSS